MRAREFIGEGVVDTPASTKNLAKEIVAPIKGALSMPEISNNKAGGSPYLQWRFGIAMAGAPDFPTPPAGPMAGDPLISTYTDVDLEIVNKAAKMVGAGKIVQLTNNRSCEISDTNKTSPVKPFKGYGK